MPSKSVGQCDNTPVKSSAETGIIMPSELSPKEISGVVESTQEAICSPFKNSLAPISLFGIIGVISQVSKLVIFASSVVLIAVSIPIIQVLVVSLSFHDIFSANLSANDSLVMIFHNSAIKSNEVLTSHLESDHSPETNIGNSSFIVCAVAIVPINSDTDAILFNLLIYTLPCRFRLTLKQYLSAIY